jgi:hypothetical protein
MNVRQARRLYNVHVHTNHPEYERWNKQMKMKYFVTILLALVPPSIVILATPINVARLFVILIWASALIVGASVWAAQRKGTRRFRDSWKQEHGAQINPQ